MKKKKELIFYSALVLVGTFCVGMLASSKTFSFINADPTAHRITINADNPVVSNDMGTNHHAGKKTVWTDSRSTREFEYRQAHFDGTKTSIKTDQKYYAGYIANTERIGSLRTLTLNDIEFEKEGSSLSAIYLHWGWNYADAYAFDGFIYAVPEVYPGYAKLDLTPATTTHTFNFNNEGPSYFYLSVGFEGIKVSFSSLEITFKDASGGCEATPEVTPQVVDEHFIYKAVTGGYEVVGQRGGLELTNLVIPSTVNGANVVRIGNEAFKCNELIQTVTLPNTITEIGFLAFAECVSLSQITIPGSVTSIGAGAFQSCTGLKTVTLNEGLEIINSNAFYNCILLNAITLPNTLTDIGYSAFENCKSLTSVHIPANVATMGSNPFSKCSNLTSLTVDSSNLTFGDGSGSNVIIRTADNALVSGIRNSTIPSSVTEIEYFAFDGQKSLTAITLPANLASIGTNAFRGTGLVSVSIPNSVTSLEYGVFQDCSSLTTVNIPTGINSISAQLFENCTSIASISIPNNINSIHTHAFRNTALTSIHIPSSVNLIAAGSYSNAFEGTANTLTSVTVDAANATFDSRNGCNAIVLTSTNSLIVGSRTTVIPDNVEAIEGTAFLGCKSITNLVLPNSVTQIGEAAFKDCSAITQITFPTNLDTIGQDGFANCTSLTAINLPSGITGVSEGTFSNCSAVTSLHVPATLTDFTETSFVGVAASATSISVENGHPFLSDKGSNGIFLNTGEGELLALGCANTLIPLEVGGIYPFAYAGCKFTSFEVPSHVLYVGFGAFALCDNLATLTVASANPVYDSRDNCNAVIETATNKLIAGTRHSTIPASVTDFAEGALFALSSSGAYSVPANMTYIPDLTFAISSFTSVVIPNTVRFIGYGAFAMCPNLTTLVIPSSVETITNGIVFECYNLEVIYCEHTRCPVGWHIEWEFIYEDAELDSIAKWYSDTPIYDGNHWHYVGGVPTIWVI